VRKKGSIRLDGIGASPGVAVGVVHLLDGRRPATPRRRIEEGEVEAEVERLGQALATSEGQLEALKRRIEAREGPEHALLVEAHRLMLGDPAFADRAIELVRTERINAERAVRRVARELREAFRLLDGVVFQERRGEVEFLADRVVRNLVGEQGEVEPGEIPAGSILVVRDLSPADAAAFLLQERGGGLVMERGTQVSHTAIIAHARGIPAVVGLGAVREQLRAGETVVVDGEAGVVLLRPSPEEEEAFRRLRLQRLEAARALEGEQGATVTTDGVEVRLCANLEFEEELPAVRQVGAAAVGLYRTEFLYLDRRHPPTEEEHFEAYLRILAGAGGRPVTFRTFDIGADKLAKGQRGSIQPNPALGLRALRFASRHPELLATQLRGLLRASAHGPLRIMFPLVSGVEELRMGRALLDEAREALRRRGQPQGEAVPVGAMIEVPAAALVADHLAREVDFFSIGTNDLIQYALAADRYNRDVAYLYRPLDPAILRLIRMVVQAAGTSDLPLTVCGEMAGEPLAALALVGLGVRGLSMTPGSIPQVRRALRRSGWDELRRMMEEALSLGTASEVESLLRAGLASALGLDSLALPGGEAEDPPNDWNRGGEAMPKTVTPQEAHELMQQQGYVYVDVRSPHEYERSHPVGAINLPWFFLTEEGRRDNPAFLDVFRKVLPPGSKVVIGCAGGNRSAQAVRALEQAGWDGLVECSAGFSGARDASGALVRVGWSDSGLPCASGEEAGKSWEDLSRR
jgi:phosphotransferase system enzyme I (PtsI)